MLSLTLLLVLAAFITCVLSAMSKCPTYVPVLFLCILELIRVGIR